MTRVLLACSTKILSDVTPALRSGLNAHTLSAVSYATAVALFKGQSFSCVVLEDGTFFTADELDEMLALVKAAKRKIAIVVLSASGVARRQELEKRGLSVVEINRLPNDLVKALTTSP